MSENQQYKRGSEWRKWDLHVHTKGTAKNDQFSSKDFDTFCVRFFREALEKRISAVGITDYFSIDNYLKVKEFVTGINSNKNFTEDQKLEIKKILIIPNVELRMTPVTDKNKLVNIHCLFNPEYVENLNNDFFNSIEYVMSKNRYPMNREGITELGKSLDLNLDTDEEKYKKGVDNFVVSHESLQKLREKNSFKENTIIAVSNSSKDGASALQKHFEFFEGNEPGSLEAVRKSIYYLSQVIFSGNSKDKEYFLGKSVDDQKTVENKCGSLKPCIHGSDAHKEEDLFNLSGDKYCWIKADLTFEGLRHIIYEPEDRVYIGHEPSVLKRVRDNKTKYIHSLTINNKTNQKAKKGAWFKNVNLEFNSELVSIIGNKGSGKSAISDIIGVLCDAHNAGDNHEYLSFLNNSKNQKRFREKGFAEKFEATIEWKDGKSTQKSLDENIDKDKIEKVKYLPQNFFESLTNDLEKEGFEETLKEVIFRHIPEADRHGRDTFDELEKYKISSIEKDLPIFKDSLNKLSDEIIKLEEKNHPNYINRLKNFLEEREKELSEHEKNKPEEVKNPTESKELKGIKNPTESKESKSDKIKEEKSEGIKKLNNELDKLESDIGEKKRQENKTSSEIEELRKIYDDLIRFEKRIDDYKEDNRQSFEKFEFKIDDLIETKFDHSVVQDKIDNQSKYLAQLKMSLKTLKDIESGEDGDKEKIEKAKKGSLIIQRDEMKEKIDNLKDELSKPERDYQEYREKLKEWEDKKKNIKGNAQNPESNTIEFYKNEINFIDNKLVERLTQERIARVNKSIEIFRKKKEIIDLYEELKKSIDDKIGEDKEFRKKFKMEMNVSFKIDNNFRKTFFEFINQNKTGTFYGKIEGENFLSLILEEKDLTKERDIQNILETIIKFLETDQRKEIGPKNKDRKISDQITRKKEFYEFIFSLEYLKPNYELKLDGKVLEKLSPGERGALLLVFYLMLDKENTPLVIDQPEDNLDNKSVFEILTHFIRDAKKRRQIIIVTHNPNLAVCADAEQVIYVHLDKNDYKFSYETGSIESPILNKRIVEILEGTQPAFDRRKLKYQETK